MATVISFRGVAVATTANCAAWSVVAAPILADVLVAPAPQGSGEFVKDLGRHGAECSLSIRYRVADGGLAGLVTLWEGLGGTPRGVLVTPTFTLERCIVVSAAPSEPVRRRLEAGPGWLQEWAITFRRSA